MAGPANGVLGDQNLPDPGPQADPVQDPVVEEGRRELERAAKFAKTPEFQTLKDHLEKRIEFYQKYLPDGRNIMAQNPAELSYMWPAANAIIGEMQAIINGFSSAADSLREDNGQRPTS